MDSTSNNTGQITTREELIFALSRAAELEHGLTCIYLFAAFSMKRSLTEGIDEIQQDQIRNWEAVVLEVAKQEMEHLGMVCNLLNSIGAPQHFDRPNFPQSPEYYSTQGAFTLEKFSVKTIQRFMEFEKPAPTSFAAGEVEGDGLVSDEIATTGFHTVQELYASILRGFENLDQDPDVDLFIGPPEAQLEDDDIVVGFGNLEYGITVLEVTDLATAREAIQEIIEQGEGIALGQLPPTEDTFKLQELYQKIVIVLQGIENLVISDDDWQATGAQLVAALTLLLPTLEHVGEVLEDEKSYLAEQYNDSAIAAHLVSLLRKAFRELDRLKKQVENILNADKPDCSAKNLKLIQKQAIEITKYDVEGITLSGFIEPDSHYLQFWRIYEQIKQIKFEPARNVAPNPALRLHSDNQHHELPVTIVSYPYSRQVMEVFNACYETMVQMLIIIYSYNRISEADRTLLINTAFFPFMTMVIRPFSELLTQLPAHELDDASNYADTAHAGPPFEFYIDIAYLPNREQGWIYLNERLQSIAAASDGLKSPPQELAQFLGCEMFEKLEKQMAFLHRNLVRIAANFKSGTQPTQ